MQVLIVDDVLERQENLTIAMLKEGYQVTSTASRKVAQACIQCAHVDVLIVIENLAGQLTHSLALLAEYQNPMLATILMTPRTEDDVDELFQLLPSVHCLVGLDVAPDMIGKLARASLQGPINTPNPATLPPRMRDEEPLHELATLADVPALPEQMEHAA